MSKLKLHASMVAGALGVALLGSAQAAVLTNGTGLNLNVRDDNGAIFSTSLGGNEYYRLGAFVSDWGLQVGTNTGSFQMNNTNGGEGISVSVSAAAGVVSAAGTYTGGGANVGLTRSYSLVTGFDAILTSTTFTNHGTSAITLRYFDTFDPDQGSPQGLGPGTTNDVLTVAGNRAAQSTAGARSVLWGELPPPSMTAGFSGGFGLGITNGGQLNNLFSAPVDPNGGFSDIGVGLAWEITLAAGETMSLRYVHVYDTTASGAQADYAAIVDSLSDVPEPGTLALLGLSGVLFAASRRRKAK